MYVLNIGFNKNNPEHREAANILNQMGHTKADYIAKAVVDFDAQTGKVSGNGLSIDYRNLEQMVRKILDEQTEESQINEAEEAGENKVQEPELKEEDMMGIMQALQGFRK